MDVAPTLARTLRSTNVIESMISVCREHAGNVKRWRDGQMALFRNSGQPQMMRSVSLGRTRR